MNHQKMLPVGYSDFKEIASGGFYYVDKTGFIAELLQNMSKVNLFTRPRRFGKSLNLNMLKYFFEYGGEASLFQGLRIAQHKELCSQHLGKYPVLYLSFKDAGGRNLEEALQGLSQAVGNEAQRFDFLDEDEKLNAVERKRYAALRRMRRGVYCLTTESLRASLRTLSDLLYKHFGQKCILLIDEYDVPLDMAYQYGYYDDMIRIIRDMFSSSMKDSPSLYAAFIMGCLRISKESIFTGFNNPRVYTITDTDFEDFFGFTEEEVTELLHYYGLEGHLATVREWYDGYLFGERKIYCPWDVINYVATHRKDRDAEPQNFWANSSGNGLLIKFLQNTEMHEPQELEILLGNGIVEKRITQELIYYDLDIDPEYIWSILFMTGYLTVSERPKNGIYRLSIPNRELAGLMAEEIQTLFRKNLYSDQERLGRLGRAFLEKDTAVLEKMLNAYLANTLSIRDNAQRADLRESFYHGYFLGILGSIQGVSVKSNREAGNGYADILMLFGHENIGIVIEVKYSVTGNLEKESAEALRQIHKMQYTEYFKALDVDTVYKYGIACYRKKCRVMSE